MPSGAGRIDWRRYALKLALVASERSEDPFLKVGACVLRSDNSVAGLGYNGAPPGINLNWENRDERRLRVVHAETNALRYCEPGRCSILACSHLPCNDCLKTIATYGIREVIFNEVYIRDISSLDVAGDLGIKLFCTLSASKTTSADYEDVLEVIENVV
tara:strand:- start:1186 stop:1662 length:477 start_codon:yes stop_codon:yes gene_type:complete